MTPMEIDLHMKGYQMGRDREYSVLAHFTASLINGLRLTKGRKVRNSDLYRPYQPEEERREKRASLQTEFDKAVALMGTDKRPSVVMKGR